MGESSEAKFEQIYDTYYDSVYKYIYVCVKDKWNAEDIISTVFVKVYENVDKLGDVSEVRNWIFRVAHNAVIDFRRKNGKVIPIDTFMDEGKEDDEYENIVTRDEFKTVKKYIEQLPEETRNIIYMRFYADLKFKDIAQTLNKPENTIKTTLSRAMKKIKQNLEKSIVGGERYGSGKT